ncbi:MAG: WG repeat-containing protein [Pirellulaceae bacterium]
MISAEDLLAAFSISSSDDFELKWLDVGRFRDGVAGVHLEYYDYDIEEDMSEILLIDKSGNCVQAGLRKGARPFSEGLSYRPNVYGYGGKFVNIKGEEFISTDAKSVTDFSQGLAAFKNQEDLWGFMDKKGNVILENKWAEARSFHENLAPVKNADGLWGFIQGNGDIYIDCRWIAVGDFNEGRAWVRDANELFGYIDIRGNVLVPPKYAGVTDYQEKIAVVVDQQKNVKYLDLDGNLIMEGWQASPSEIHDSSDFQFHDGIAIFRNDQGLFGCIDRTGKVVVEPIWKAIGGFSDGLLPVQCFNGNCGYIRPVESNATRSAAAGNSNNLK